MALLAKEELFFETKPGSSGLVRVAKERWGQGFRYHSPRFERFFLGYVREGEAVCRHEDGNGWEKLQPGSLFSHFPGKPRELRVTGPFLDVYLAVAHDGKLCRRARSICGPASFVSPQPESAGIDLIFEQIMREAAEGGDQAPEICANYLEIILRKSADTRAGSSFTGPLAERRFQACRRYIERHFTRLKTTAEVAEGCAVHPVHLCRLFRRFAKETPWQYLTRLRMRRASQLLVESSATVQEIAWQTGWDDAFAFSRAFKRSLGVSPLQFRQSRSKRKNASAADPSL